MKKLFISLSIGSILAATFSPVFVSASGADDLPFLHVTDVPLNNAQDNTELDYEMDQIDSTVVIGEDIITTEVATDTFIKYQITENDQTFDLIFNHETSEVVVDNLVFDMDVYLSTISENDGSGSIKELTADITPKTVTNSYESNLNNDSQVSVMATVPTTGYSALISAGTYKKLNMIVGLRTAALTAIAGFVFKGNVPVTKTFVTTVLKAAVSAGIITGIDENIKSDVYYDLKQAHHKTVANAVKETRRPFTKIQSKKIYGPTKTYYFFSSRPY